MEDKQNNQASSPGPIDLTRGLSDRLSLLDVPEIILASGSPRRAEILKTVNWPFKVVSPDIAETRFANEDAVSYVQRLALAKAEAVALRVAGSLIVAADTTVVIGAQVLEKPSDQNDARRMLRQLSGEWHQVITGVAVIDTAASESRVSCETTVVKFAAMGPDEIEWYVSSGEPMDKAGAYAIQGLGARFVEGIRGDFFNVMGLPVRLLYEMLQQFAPKGARTSLSA